VLHLVTLSKETRPLEGRVLVRCVRIVSLYDPERGLNKNEKTQSDVPDFHCRRVPQGLSNDSAERISKYKMNSSFEDLKLPQCEVSLCYK
jgi:hypothetical protein